MVMREIEDPFGLKMDVWADEVIDEAILSWDCGAQSLGRSHRSVYRLLQPVQA